MSAISCAAAVTVAATGCIVTEGGGSRTTNDTTVQHVVIGIDVTNSIRGTTRLSAKNAIADAIPQLAGVDHGLTTIQLRKVNHYSGTERAEVATYTIPAVRACSNPLDQKCRRTRDAELAEARERAGQIRDAIRNRTFKTESAGTVIRPAFAAAGDILRATPGSRWFVIASDLLPSHASPPPPHIDLSGVHVVVLFLCRDAIAVCQERQADWTAEIADYGATSVNFASPSQAAAIFDAKSVSQ